jgi:hypothetical protein
MPINASDRISFDAPALVTLPSYPQRIRLQRKRLTGANMPVRRSMRRRRARRNSPPHFGHACTKTVFPVLVDAARSVA